MENHLQAVVVGIGEDIFIKAHRLLLVAAEEVDLYSADSYLLEPFHLLASCHRVAHYVAWSLWRVVLSTVGVVP